MNKTKVLSTKMVFLPSYFKLDTGNHVEKDVANYIHCELPLIKAFTYIGKKYYKRDNPKTKCSNFKCGITYIHEKCTISKNAIKLWCKTIYSNFKHKEYVYIYKMSDKIFKLLNELAHNDKYFENMIYGSTNEAAYYHIASMHARNIDSYANNINYPQHSELAELKAKLDNM